MVTSRFRRLIQLALPILAALGCSGGDLVIPSGGTTLRLELTRGGGQVGTVGRPLSDSVVVRLLDEGGDGVAGRAVTWTVTGGAGSVTPDSDTTDANGFASARWTLGPAAGANTLEAAVVGAGSVAFTATAGAGAGSGASAVRSTLSAEPTSIPSGTGESTITVQVRDDGGDPVEGAVVVIAATGGGNTLTQPAALTGSNGVVTGTLASSEPGTKRVSAVVDGTVLIEQTATVVVTPTAQTRLELIEGNNQSAPVGTRLPVQPAVRVVDAQGLPVAGVDISFVVTGGGGRVDSPAQTTNTDGIARSGDWTLGATPGANTLEARAASVEGSPVVFNADGTSGGGGGGGGSGDVDHFVFQVQPPDVDEDETFTVQVAMVNAAGDVVPLSGIEIYLGLIREGEDTPSNERLSGSRFVDTQNGIAVFTVAVTKKGRYRLRALSDELPALGPNGPEPFLFSRVFEVN